MDKTFYEEIAEEILQGQEVQKAKIKVCRKYSSSEVPSNSRVLSHLSPGKKKKLVQVLRKKPVRTLSGVAVIAVMTSPAKCPHGRCIYCPKGEDAPQSYTGYEPAALRGLRSKFDPFLQVYDRLNQLYENGHNVEKAELIVMGGTFMGRDKEYQDWFVARCFDAMNSFNSGTQTTAGSVNKAHLINETAHVRNVGVTFETRPDFAMEGDVDAMLRLGGTRVELGVQTLNDAVYEKVNRGHKVRDVVESTRIVKDSGLKLCYHMMPGLFTGVDEDLKTFDRILLSSDFRPDMVKIYPTLVLEGTGLYELWKKGEFHPLSTEECVKLIGEVKKRLPKWVRTMRVQRDIPSRLIEAGVKKGNLGELVEQKLLKEGVRCRCIRCRESGLLGHKKGLKDLRLEILEECYEASGGMEHFISFEDLERDVIAGYLRLRFPSSLSHRPEIGSDCAIIRELKVTGLALKIGEAGLEDGQHRGLGKRLLERAAWIAGENGRRRLLVTSSVGTREYYNKLGFKRNGVYMEKRL